MNRNIREYQVFKKAHEGVLLIYRLTAKFPAEERFGLASQMRRSSYSIPMNLVEGAGRESEGEFGHFVNIAKGSCDELIYQLDLAKDLNYIAENDHDDLSNFYDQIARMLYNLRKTLKAQGA
jgi:four helix bundle protein